MDPLAEGSTINAQRLPRWVSPGLTGTEHAYDGDGTLSPRFPARAALNAKLALWHGPIWELGNVGAIVNPTNETLSAKTGICRDILAAAGPAIAAECEASEGCRTGEAVSTRACQLACRRLIHTVGPRYNEKYKTAAENALHNCYRSCLRVAKEEGLRSVALPCLYTQRKGYPRAAAAHIAARTVRRFLEHWGDDLDLIVLVVDSAADARIYEATLRLYLPRSAAEERAAAAPPAPQGNRGGGIGGSIGPGGGGAGGGLPENVGNEFGETVIEDRKIRVSNSVINDPRHGRLTDTSRFTLTGRLPSAFGNMDAHDQDERRLEQIRLERMRMSRAQLAEEGAHLAYSQYVRRARGEELEDIAALGILSRAGADSLGRPVVLFAGAALPVAEVDMERVLLYMVRVLDPIVERPYVIVYLHTGVTDANRPELAWLRATLGMLARKYKKNVAHIYVVHPSFWTKAVFWFLTPFISGKFWRKLVYVESVADLLAVAPQLQLPENVFAYDQAQHGSSSSSSSSSSGGGGSDAAAAAAAVAAAAAAAASGGGGGGGGGGGDGGGGGGGAAAAAAAAEGEDGAGGGGAALAAAAVAGSGATGGGAAAALASAAPPAPPPSDPAGAAASSSSSSSSSSSAAAAAAAGASSPTSLAADDARTSHSGVLFAE